MRPLPTITALAALAALASCNKPKADDGGGGAAADVDVEKVTSDAAKAFADSWVATVSGSPAGGGCQPDKVAALIDDQAFRARVAKRVSGANSEAAASQLDAAAAARIICAWQKPAEDYRLLRVRPRADGPEPLTRRLVKNAKNVVAVNYEDLMLGTSKADHKVHVLDVYSYMSGQWLSEMLGDNVAALMASDNTVGDADAMKKAIELQKQNLPVDALAVLDKLPDPLRKTREVQMMRLALGEAISPDAHQQAIDEIEHAFPNDPSVALLLVDGAFLHKDYNKALHEIDLVDTAIGGDAFQEAIRAEAYLARKQPGDLDLAKQHADLAIKNEPTLAKGWYAEVDVALAQARWVDALAAMDTLTSDFGAVWHDEKLQTIPSFAGLVRSAEYSAWLAKKSGGTP